MANGGNGSKITVSKETLLPVSLMLVIVGSAFWFGVEKTRLEAQIATEALITKGLVGRIEKLEDRLDKLRLAQVKWDVRLEEASEEAYRAIGRAKTAEVKSGVNEKRIDNLERKP